MRNRGSISVEKDIIGLVRGREYNGIEKKCGVDKTREVYGSARVGRENPKTVWYII